MQTVFRYYRDFAESLENIVTGPSEIVLRENMSKLLTKTPTTKGDLFAVEKQGDYRVFDNKDDAIAEFFDRNGQQVLICKGNIVAVPAEFFEEDADRDTVQVEIVCEATPRDVLILIPGMVERYTEDEIAEYGMHTACWVVRKLDNNEAWVICSDYMMSAA